MSDTEPVTAIRSVWTACLELSRQADMGSADRIMSVAVTEADYETKPFLALRLKLIAAIQNCYEEENLKKIDGGGSVEEASDEVELTIAEATYLDMILQVTTFKGALTLKRDLWRVISTLYERHRKAKEAQL